MSVFGWSYPPGAENDPYAPYNEAEPPCAICLKDCQYCDCPTCPRCEAVGDPHCYAAHGLIDPKPIKSVRDLARNCYCWDDEGGWVSAIKAVERGVYKYTDCGASARSLDMDWPGAVSVSGYCEGSDAEHPAHTLTFPFAESDWFAALDQCETESRETWDSTHGCEECWSQGYCTESEELECGNWPINPKCTNCNGDGVIL